MKVFATVFLSLGSVAALLLLLVSGSLKPGEEWRLFGLGLFALGLSALTASTLAHQLRRPIRRLARATRQLARGNFATRLPDLGRDELGQLGRDFNLLAQALERQELSRRQWVADTSHELRTPLAVLLAEVEALQDRVHEPDERALGLLHTQLTNLSKLVEDLHWLARSDEGLPSTSMVALDLVELIGETAEAFRHRLEGGGLSLELELTDEALCVLGDPEQLRRLLANLLENSLRYTDPGGQVRLTCSRAGESCRICLDDSLPGVPERFLSRIFDRFFRVDASRSRRQGGSGLGLAICRNIVTVHQGTIRTAASPLGGLRVEIALPCFRRKT